MPRQSALTDQVQSAVLEAVRAGVTFEVAAQHAGIDRGTFHRWMELGKDAQGCITPEDKGKQTAVCPETAAGSAHAAGECPHLARFRDFRDSVLRAEANLHTLLAGHIVKAAPRDWHAGMAMLKAKWPKTWNVPTVTRLEGGLEVEVTLSAREAVRTKLEDLHERGLIALPSPSSDDGPRLDRAQEDDDASDEAQPEAAPEPSSARRRSPPARRTQRGPIVA